MKQLDTAVLVDVIEVALANPARTLKQQHSLVLACQEISDDFIDWAAMARSSFTFERIEECNHIVPVGELCECWSVKA